MQRIIPLLLIFAMFGCLQKDESSKETIFIHSQRTHRGGFFSKEFKEGWTYRKAEVLQKNGCFWRIKIDDSVLWDDFSSERIDWKTIDGKKGVCNE